MKLFLLTALFASVSLATTPVTPVPSTMFSMTLHDSFSAWPNVTIGGLKGVPQATWVYIEPNAPINGNHTYNWGPIDRYTAEAAAHNVPVFWTTVGIPCWAAADPATCTQTPAGGATNSESTGEVSAGHLADFDAFITALVTRYKGKIDMYELWNEPYNTAEYTGGIPHMVTLTNHFHNIVRSIDPAVKIATPSGDGFVASWFTTYYNDGGTTDVDVVTLHGETGSVHPESIQGSILTAMQTVWAAHGLGAKPIWDTEAEPGISQTNDQLASFVAVHYLLHWSLGITREYWYAWSFEDNSTAQLLGTVAGVAYQQVYNWMVGSTMDSACSLNGSSDVNNATYTCSLTANGTTNIAAWNSSGSGSYTPPAGYTTYKDLAGNVHNVSGAVSLTNAPVLFIAPQHNTYYVSSSGGSDSNPGTSTATPWQSIAQANSGPVGGYLPGDMILFKTGDTWTGNLITHNSGTSGNQITYGSYGTGAKPVINGAVTANHNFVTITGLQIQGASTLVSSNNVTGTVISNNLFKNASSRVVSAVGSNVIITITGNTYLPDAGHALPSSGHVFFVQSTGVVTMSNNSVDQTISPGGLAINFNIWGGGAGSSIDHNVSHGGTQAWTYKPYNGSNCQVGDFTTTNVVILNNYADGITSAADDGEASELEGCATSGAAPQSNVTMARNIIVCKAGGWGLGTSDGLASFHSINAVVTGNIVLGDCGAYDGPRGHLTSNPRMNSFSSSSTGMKFYNNTIVGVGRANVPAADWLNNSGSGVDAKNNIIKNASTGLLKDTGTMTASYNIFDSDVGTPMGGGITDAGNNLTNTSPQFVSSSPVGPNDVKLQSGSPAITSGNNLGNTYKTIIDPLSTNSPYNTFDQSSGWMRGAFGFTGGPPPPTISSFIANPTSITQGGSSQLTCTANNFTSLSVVGVGPVSSGVPITVSPSATTQYDCRAVNSVSQTDAFATVTVNAPGPVINTFTANPVAIITGQSSTLQWTTTNAVTCSLDQGIGTVACNSSRSVSPLATTTYHLTATNSQSASTTGARTVAVNVTTTIKGAVMQGGIIP